MRRWCCLLLLLSWLSLPVPATAQETTTAGEESEEEEADERLPVFTPGEIIVVGSRTPAEMSASIEEVTADDIRALGATNAAEAIRILAGVRVDTAPTSLSANGKQEELASIRGFDPHNVIVMIDGVPIYEPYFRILDLRQIPVGSIAKIQIIRGPSSVLYGPNSMGGVINIITRRGVGQPRGHLDVSYGDVESYFGNSSVLGGYRGFEYFANAGFAGSAGFPMSHDFDETRNEGGGLRFNSDFRDYYAGGNFGYYRGLNGLTLSLNHYSFSGGVPFSMEAVEPSTLWRKRWDQTMVTLQGETAPLDWLYARGRVFYTRFFNTITTYTDSSMSAVASEGDGVSTYDNSVYGYVLLPEFLLGNYGAIKLSHIYKYDRVSIQDEVGQPWYDFGAETYSVGGQYEARWLDFNLTLGAAYHIYRRVETPEEDLGEDDVAFDYQAGLAYSPFPVLTIFAAGAHKSSFPDLKTLYGSNGNPDLNPEFAYNLDAGLRLSFLDRQINAEAIYFYADITDLIGQNDLGNDFYYENIDSAMISGLETSLRLLLFDGLLYLAANHTYMVTRDEREYRLLESLDFRPEQMLNLDGRLNFSFGTRVSVQYSYVGERRYELPGTEASIRTMPEYGITNVRLGQTIPWDAGRTAAELFVQAKNIFDVYYEEAPEKPAPGRTFFAGFALDF